jgi:hypothetical protein
MIAMKISGNVLKMKGFIEVIIWWIQQSNAQFLKASKHV